jgi:hypothetical protein
MSSIGMIISLYFTIFIEVPQSHNSRGRFLRQIHGGILLILKFAVSNMMGSLKKLKFQISNVKIHELQILT